MGTRLLSRPGYRCSRGCPTADIHALSLHDALPILGKGQVLVALGSSAAFSGGLVEVDLLDLSRGTWTIGPPLDAPRDRKSTRLNSSHLGTSYAVFCLKKKP